MSFTKFFAAPAVLTIAGSAALAGPYANIESNAGFVGSDYQGAVTEFHVGFGDEVGENASYYIQAGPALVSPDGGETDTELSGKLGGNYGVSERVDIYGEVSFITGDENNYGTKLGVTYNFW